MAEKSSEDRAAARAKFQKTIERLDTLCKTRPNLYFARLVGLVALGYAYIWFALGLLCILSGLLILLLIKLPILAIKLAIPLLLVIGLILRSFWIKGSPAPQGIYLNKKDHTAVFDVVEEIRQAISAPPVDEIVVITEFNAAVAQIPRLGLLGWHKNYLLLGMPLMQAFSLDQLKAVLAHEMGHLASSHGARCAWIYQVRGIWSQLMDNLSADESFATLLFGKFFSWYAPYFDASSFALCRVQEYHADTCAVDLVGKEASAAMLVGTNIKGSYIETKYWAQLWEGSKHSKTPYEHPYSDITTKINTTITREQAQSWLDQALKRKTDYQNTHPSLTERIKEILGVSPEEAAQWARSNMDSILHVDEPASEKLFGSKLPDLMQQLDKKWCIAVEPSWAEQYQRYEDCRSEIAALEEKSAHGQLSDDDLVTLACATATVRSFDDAASLFAEAFAKSPGHAQLHYHYGQCLLEQENPDGVRYLEQAMQLDRTLAIECCSTIYTFLKWKGHDDEAHQYIDLAQNSVEEWVEARKERASVFAGDSYSAHGLDKNAWRI